MSEANPYASPTAAPDLAMEMEVSASELQVATQGKRFLNFIVDNILVQVLAGVAAPMFATVFVSLFGAPETAEAVEQFETTVLIFLLLFLVGYFVMMEWLFQRTLAKFITNTKVVSVDGTKPTFTQVLRRTLVRFVPLEPFSFLRDPNPVGWHDRWSSTRVVAGR